MRTWRFREARGRFKDLVDEAIHRGPQRIAGRRGQAVVVVSEEAWNRVAKDIPSFGRLLASCPLSDADAPPRRPVRVVGDRIFD